MANLELEIIYLQINMRYDKNFLFIIPLTSDSSSAWSFSRAAAAIKIARNAANKAVLRCRFIVY